MQLARIIRKNSKLSVYKMSKIMKKPITSYQIFEKKTKKILLKDLLMLHEISGLSVLAFWQLIETTVQLSKKRKI